MAVRPIDAVHVLNDISWHHKPTPVSEFESGFNQGINQAMWIITHAPTLTPPNEWVSVDDRLPEEDPHIKKFIEDEIFGLLTVLVYNGEVKQTNRFFCNAPKFGFSKTDGWEWASRNVTHWMPLPAPPNNRPPEGEEDNND
jgi:hypothetical protein